MTVVSVFDGDTRLSFACEQGDSRPDTVQVTLNAAGLSATRGVFEGWESGFLGLVSYFESMAESWRGWAGERRYESLDGDLRLTATNNGHVQMDVLLRETSVLDGWTVTGHLELEVGEQLARAAADLRELLL